MTSKTPARRVVVTGMGLICPLGPTPADLWQGLVTGRSGIVPITRFDPARFSTRYAGQVDDRAIASPDGPLRFETRRMSAFVRYALFAADQAVRDSGIAAARAHGPDGEAPTGFPPGGAVYLGIAMGGLPAIETGVLEQERAGVRRASPYLIPSLIPNMAASLIALRHGIDEEQLTIAGACASGTQALGHALRSIRSGARKWAIAGGSEAVLTPITFSGFQAMRVLSRCEDPAAAPRPFDRDRDGTLVGEAAAVFVLEERAHAEARGATIHGELAGFATNSGNSDITDVSPSRIARCIEDALRDAGTDPGGIDCVFSQSSGMVQGDAAELEAVRRVTADLPRTPVVTSIKGHTGYMFAANGPMNLAGALMALRHQTVPPTLKFERPDPAFAEIDIARETRPTSIRRCLINSFGFGGINATLVVSGKKSLFT